MTIHRDTPPPVIQGVTYTAVQTNDREHIDRLDRKGETVYIWKDKRNQTWVAVRDSGEVPQKE